MKNKTFLFSLPLFATMILSACGETHTHSFGEAFEHDENNHWHVCECGEKDELIPHVWGEGVQTTAPTCDAEGIMTFTCECGATKTETIASKGHTAATEWQSDETSHWHSCINEGCYEELNKADHDFEEDMTQHQDSTCTAKGKKVLVCKTCNYSKEEEIPMAEHAWDTGVVTTDPTCEGAGVKTYTCNDCGRTRTEQIDPTGHDWENKESSNAYQFDSQGTWQECKVCHTHQNDVTTKKAPWAAFDFQDETNIVIEHSDPTAYDWENHALTSSNYNDNNGVKYTIADIVDKTRLVIDVTLTVDGETSWGAQASLFFFDELGNKLGSSFCLKTNPYQNVDKHETRYTTKVFENGTEVNSLSAQGVEFTYRFDFRGYDKAPRAFAFNGANGVEETPDVITIKSIVAKETTCGHSADYLEMSEQVASTCSVAGYKEYTCSHDGCGSKEYKEYLPLEEHTPTTETGSETAYQYQWAGTRTVCSECGEILDDSETIQAPWLRLNPTLVETSTIVDNGNNSYTSVASSNNWNNNIQYKIPELKGRTLLYVTFQTADTWDFYLNVGDVAGSQFVTASAKINWGGNQLLTDVLGPKGEPLGYNAETSSIGAKVSSNKTTLVFDLSKIAEKDIVGKVVKVTFYTPGQNYCSVDLRTPCDHTETEVFNSALNCGTKCKSCGEIVNSYVNSISMSYGKAEMKDSFTLTEDFEFDGKTCAKIYQAENFNSADAGYTQNYKVKLNGLLQNMKNAGMKKVSFDFYVENANNGDVRFYWGVGENKDYAWADHNNNVTAMPGASTVIAENSTFTALGARECGAKGNGFYCNDWYRLTIDVSDATIQSYSFFFFGAMLSLSSTNPFPSTLYITNMQVSA